MMFIARKWRKIIRYDISFADLYLNLYYHDNGDVCNDRTNRDHVPMETTWRSAKQELPVTVFKD